MNFFEIIKAVKVQNEEDIPTSFASFLADDAIIAQEIIDAINSVNISICNSQNWNFRERRTTFQTVIAQSDYIKPVGKIWLMKHQDQITPLTEIHYDYIIKNPTSGTPYCYSFYGDKLILYPTPTEAKTVTPYFYTNNFAKAVDTTEKLELSVTDDVSIIPAHLHKILVYAACIEYYKKPSREKSMLWQSRYEQCVTDLNFACQNSVNDYARVVFGERPNDMLKDFFDPRK